MENWGSFVVRHASHSVQWHKSEECSPKLGIILTIHEGESLWCSSTSTIPIPSNNPPFDWLSCSGEFEAANGSRSMSIVLRIMAMNSAVKATWE